MDQWGEEGGWLCSVWGQCPLEWTHTMASIHAHTNNIMTFGSCERTVCASPTHQHHGGIFNPFFLQAGRCHSARPSSNPSVGTLSKISVKLTQRKKILPCLFCLSFLLCYAVESLLRNQSGFFLTCLDIFASS